MFAGVSGVLIGLTGVGCGGDDDGTSDVADTREVAPDGEVTDEVTGATGEDSAADAEDVDTSPDPLDGDDADDAGDATPEQRAILGVPETARFELAGLTAPVHVVRTEGSIPRIYAHNRDDLGRVLGFVQARDRFFFMDVQRRLGLGSIAELLGDLGLSQDLDSRMTGMTYVTDRLVEHMSPELASYLAAFADGVNAYIEAVAREELPPPTETVLAGALGYASPVDMMKPFALRDVVALEAALLYNTNFESGDVGAQAAADRLDALFAGVTDEELRKSGFLGDAWHDIRGVFPGTNSTEGFGVGKAHRSASGAASGRGGAKRLPAGMAERLSARLEALSKRLGKDREAGFGSNVWAVAGDKTASGGGILAADGHLNLAIPPIAYGAGLDTRVFGGGEIHQLGGWLANFPVMIGGTNGEVAWAGVNPVVDITDWYREEIELDEAGRPRASRFQGEWRPLVAAEETYEVANVPLLGSVGRTETWTRWTTFDGRWITSIEGRRVDSLEEAGDDAARAVNMMGDLIIPEDTDEDGVIVAISFDHAGFDATRWGDALYEMGVANDVEGAREATRGFVGGALFTGAADDGGSVLYTSYQAVPCRGYLPRGDDGVFVPGADPTRLIDGTEYGGFTLPTDEDGKADEGPGQTDPYRCIIPFSEMPYAIDPDSGFIFNANSDPAGIGDDGEERNDAWYIGGPWASVRANTIRRDLRRVTADGDAGLDDMKQMQANIDSRLGEEFTPHLLGALDLAEAAADGPLAELWAADGTRLAEARERLAGWRARGFQTGSGVETFYHSPVAGELEDSVATMIFNAWIRRFQPAVWDDERINAWRSGSQFRVAVLLRLLAGRGPDNPGGLASYNPETQESVFFDVLGTDRKETSDELMVKALVDALDFLSSEPTGPGDGGFGTADMSRWLWGLRHQAMLRSIVASFVPDPSLAIIGDNFSITTERLPLWPDLTPDDPRHGLKWFPRGGDQWSVDAANPGIGGGDFRYGSGPAMRIIFELKDGHAAGGIVLPGGQSGIADSPHFDDMVPLWLGNEYLPLRFSPSEVAAGATGREVYLPQP